MKQFTGMLTQGAMFWAALTGMRVINNALKIHVTDKYASTLGAVAPVLPSLAGLLVSTLVVPRVTKKTKVIEAFQMGASVALIDAAFNTWVKPALTKPGSDGKPSALAPYLAGTEGMVYEPIAEYVDYDNRLGEYVPDNRYGAFMVEEAVAGDDAMFMQTGGAGGIFSKTTLGG